MLTGMYIQVETHILRKTRVFTDKCLLKRKHIHIKREDAPGYTFLSRCSSSREIIPPKSQTKQQPAKGGTSQRVSGGRAVVSGTVPALCLLCTVTDIQDSRVPLFGSAILSRGIAVIRSTDSTHSSAQQVRRTCAINRDVARGSMFHNLISWFPSRETRGGKSSGGRERDILQLYHHQIQK